MNTVSRPRLRARLALLHAVPAFAAGVLLLVLVDAPLLVAGRTAPVRGPAGPGATTGNLPELLAYSAVALVGVAAVALAIGWWIAGQALRPLHLLTASSRTMSVDDLAAPVRVPAAYREFTELAETLDGLRRRLHAAFVAQRQFVANASHELRTPLAVQRALLQVTLADPDAGVETLRAACADLLALGRRQEELIGALLSLAAGQSGLDRGERFDLADLARAALRDRTAEAGRRGLRLRTDLGPAPVTGDPRLAASLVENLVDNAVRHNVPGGTVELTTAAPGRLTISNSGAVIPPAELDRLFQPFQRRSTDRTDRSDEPDQSGGHGLGLAIVASVAAAHRAGLNARARPEGGLEVRVEFPSPGPDQDRPSSRTKV